MGHTRLEPVTVCKHSGSVLSPGASEDYNEYNLDPELKWLGGAECVGLGSAIFYDASENLPPFQVLHSVQNGQPNKDLRGRRDCALGGWGVLLEQPATPWCQPLMPFPPRPPAPTPSRQTLIGCGQHPLQVAGEQQQAQGHEVPGLTQQRCHHREVISIKWLTRNGSEKLQL